MQREPYARMFGDESTDEPRENVLRNGGRSSQRKIAGEFSLVQAEILGGCRGEYGNFVSIAQEQCPGSSESDPVGSAVEETDTEIVFECFDLERHRGLAEKKMFCSLAKVQVFGDSAKDLQAKVFKLGHRMIIQGKRRQSTDSRRTTPS